MDGQVGDNRRRDSGTTQVQAGQSSRHLTNLLAIAIVVALVAVAAAYGIDAFGRATRHGAANASPAALKFNVSGVALTVPASWLRFPEQPNATFSDRLDLALDLDLGDGKPLPITLLLVPKARARASSALLDTVFLQHFTSDERQGVPGLIGKPLSGSEGYKAETVWYDPIRQDPFAAKCTAPVDEAGAGSCLRTLVLDSGLSAIIGFPETGLARWRQFDAPLTELFGRIGAGGIER